MKVLVSLSEGAHHERNHHQTEAAPILFQIFVHIAQVYVNKPSDLDKAWRGTMQELMRVFITYVSMLKSARGVDSTRSILEEMYETAITVFQSGLHSAYHKPAHRHLRKVAPFESLAPDSTVAKLRAYGAEFIDHTLGGKDENILEAIDSLIRTVR